MRKFNQPFDAYELEAARPMTIELHSKDVARYLKLIENPIYYFYAFQFTHGSLFRAIFGYEILWDRKLEEDMVSSLDRQLHRWMDRHEYYFEEIIFNFRTKLFGIPWRGRVKPNVDRFYWGTEWPLKLFGGEHATARINLLDKPHHVDLEFDDGTIWSISYVRYLNLKSKHIRINTHAHPFANGATKEKSQPRETPKATGTRFQDPSTEMAFKVFNLSKRLRRPYTLSKARQKT